MTIWSSAARAPAPQPVRVSGVAVACLIAGRVWRITEQLPWRQRLLIRARFGIGCLPLEERAICSRLGLSLPAFVQAEQDALDALGHLILEEVAPSQAPETR